MSATFGKYRLKQYIGGGRLSQVFRVGATWAPDRFEIALKRVNPSLIGDDRFVHLITREAGLLAQLNHPNLCMCHEIGVIDGCAFLTLDLINGCTLRALMRRIAQLDTALSSSSIIAILDQLLSVLGHLHHTITRPLVHLDLSPQNILLTKQGEVKVIDFGIARFVDQTDPPPLDGSIAGTIGYMSPEQARGEPIITRAADQFGVGILSGELMVGRRLFKGNTMENWHHMRTGELPRTFFEGSDHPSALVVLVKQMLAAEPGDRFASVVQAREQLQPLTQNEQAGRRTLAALVQLLMNDETFDPFDAVRTHPNLDLSHTKPIPVGDLPLTTDYADFEISIDQSEGSPSAQLRHALNALDHHASPARSSELPDSPFIEM